ncbi:MAG: helix-turn-helix transcriptional regulator [Gaiellaceae bacterium]
MRLAGERGARALAAELAEQARRLTPASQAGDLARRSLASAHAHLRAGEWPRARTIAADLLAEVCDASIRAEALLVLGEIEIDDVAVPLLEDALREAVGIPELEALIHIRLAWSGRFRNGFDNAWKDARSALELARQLGDASLELECLATLVTLGTQLGDPEVPAYAERAHRLASDCADPQLVRQSWELTATVRANEGRLDEARELLEALYEEAQERDEQESAWALWPLAWVELWSGHFEAAAACAMSARDVSLQYGLEKTQDYIPSSWVALHRGELDVARREAARGLELAEEQIGFLPPLLLAVSGIADLWTGDPAAAVEVLEEVDRVALALGWREARARPWTGDYVEALLEVRRHDEAVGVLNRWEADAVYGPELVVAHVARCRGLVAAASGDVEQAVARLEDAAGKLELAGDGFGRARALLALGVVRRRQRQKRAARDAIGAALALFEELGAATWVERARSELGTIGGRRREHGLTAAERRVAVLVAEGKTNREVAAALFLGERTVASHLSRIYAKLGVRSRTELARKVQSF